MRKRTLLAALALSAIPASNAQAVVGGKDAPAGKYPYVAEVVIDSAFGCTGTLVTPTFVVSAGHCASLTGATGNGIPIGQPGQLIDVYVGSNKAGQGQHFAVKNVTVNPNYNFLINGSGYDVSLLELSTPAPYATVKVAGKGEEGLWKPGTMATIAGWGDTTGNGDIPSTLQEAQVPITTDAYAAKAYPSDFESKTQIGAGFDQGGVDTCQGDSGGPLMVPGTTTGTLRLVGDTSYGNGCAQPHYPGIYGRLGDVTLREWIRSVAPAAVAPDAAAAAKTTKQRRVKARRTARAGTRAHLR
jgi:secreted trypsin-like serine protease